MSSIPVSIEYKVTLPSLSPTNILSSRIFKHVIVLIFGFNVYDKFFFVSKNKSWNLTLVLDLYEDKVRKESLSKLGKNV